MNDQQIRRTTALSLYKKDVAEGRISCYKNIEGHESCLLYAEWKRQHPEESEELNRKAQTLPKSVYISKPSTLNVNGKNVHTNGGIKSLNPPCKGVATNGGDHPFTCESCAKQLRDLKDTIRHREGGPLTGSSRIGERGFNTRYARIGEMKKALDTEMERRKKIEHELRKLVQTKLSSEDWAECLLDSCMNRQDKKLVFDLVRLFKSGISDKRPVQLLVIRNLVSKLTKSNNHHYVDLIKDVSGLFKNELGPTNYSLLAEIFGLAGQTTATQHASLEKLEPGMNAAAINRAARVFGTLPVNEASDGARALRYLHPKINTAGKIVLLGKAWNPDVRHWKNEELSLPRKDSSRGDKDDFTALKRLIDDLIENDKLAKNVSVHNLNTLALEEKPSIIYCMWPPRDKGYTASHLLRYWEHLRNMCYYHENGTIRDVPIHLVGHSTDSAGFSLSATQKLMTPTVEEVRSGIVFLGLGTEDERFLAPYYWFLPSVGYLDYDHEQRLFLKNLKYETRELTMWEDKGNVKRLCTVQHLKDLRNRCQKLGLECGFNATDLILIYFFDQNSDACERLFTLRIADLLDKHINGSQGTSLYIRAVYHLIEPFRKPDFGSPSEVQQSVSCGVIILRLWKKALELLKLPLNSKPGAKINPSKRGRFLTHGCYLTAEIMFAAATLHQLAMFLHFNDIGLFCSSLCNSGTKVTERTISELQGKSNEIQSLDAQPTFADMLSKSSAVQFNINAKARLARSGATVKPTAKRRRLAFAIQKQKAKLDASYKYPGSYDEFRREQVDAHKKGIKTGQRLFEEYMPPSCIQLLKDNDCWHVPYKYTHPEGMQIIDSCPSPDYNKLHLSFARDDNVVSKMEQPVSDDNESVDSVNSKVSSEEVDPVDENIILEEETLLKGKQWMISKIVDGKETYIHVSRAIKLLLPREYISRCRQKRHWASKYLPGKSPIDPKHNIVQFGFVAIKTTKKDQKGFQIGRIEVIQSVKDGSEEISFELKRNAPVRIRVSMYEETATDGIFRVPQELVISSWIAPSGIIGPVELLPLPAGGEGCYRLHEMSYEGLEKLGYYNKSDIDVCDDSKIMEEEDNNLDNGFYEVDKILERRIAKDTQTYEYKVRFKNYGQEDDMWLPASSFNRTVNFVSTSKYGRKRKHAVLVEHTDEDDASTPEKRKAEVNNDDRKQSKTNTSPSVKSSNTKPKRSTSKRNWKKKGSGKVFRKTLTTSPDQGQHVSSESDIETKTTPSVKTRKTKPMRFISNRNWNKKGSGRAFRQTLTALEDRDQDISSDTDIETKTSRSVKTRNTMPKRSTTKHNSKEKASGKVVGQTLTPSQDQEQDVSSNRGMKTKTSPSVTNINTKRKRTSSKRNSNQKASRKVIRKTLTTPSLVNKRTETTDATQEELEKTDDHKESKTENSPQIKLDKPKAKRLSRHSSIESGTAKSHVEIQSTSTSREEVIDVSSADEDEEQHPIIVEVGDSLRCSIMQDIKRRSNNFLTPRRLLAQAALPVVDSMLRNYNIVRVTSETMSDPLTLDRVPSYTIIEESMDCLRKILNKKTRSAKCEYVAVYPSYGCFSLEGLRILSRYNLIRKLTRQVSDEIKWLENAFSEIPTKDKELVTNALLDRWNIRGTYLVEHATYRITSQELSVLCCERYLTDEVLHALINKHCENANQRMGDKNVFMMLPTFLSTNFRESTVQCICAERELNQVEHMFLPVHMQGCHWGLCMFDVGKHEIRFDDGFHYAITQRLQETARDVIKTIHRSTHLSQFLPSSWSKVQRFKVPMPDQPTDLRNSSHGCGSCGVGVICSVRDICQGHTENHTWKFEDAPQLRAQLMVELLKS